MRCDCSELTAELTTTGEDSYRMRRLCRVQVSAYLKVVEPLGGLLIARVADPSATYAAVQHAATRQYQRNATRCTAVSQGATQWNAVHRTAMERDATQ
jgi:hypothetical protein